ncbi:MAG: hypothetical protein ACJ797_06230, partial [Ktedonobacteraceae bacterium]
GEKGVNPKMLEAAAESLTLHRDVIRVIDAQPDASEKHPGELVHWLKVRPFFGPRVSHFLKVRTLLRNGYFSLCFSSKTFRRALSIVT